MFNIDCAVCHGATGIGNGITSKYGLLSIANYHQDKYREMADGQIFDTITHGHNTMMAYGDKVTVKDRWAIIAYIRALQRSQNATINDVPEESTCRLGGSKMSNHSHVPAPETFQSKGMSRFMIALLAMGLISLVGALLLGFLLQRAARKDINSYFPGYSLSSISSPS